MNLRAKLFPALVAACAVALVAASSAQYRRGVRVADDALRADAEGRARRLARAVEVQRGIRLKELTDLSDAEVLDKFWVVNGRLFAPSEREKWARTHGASGAQPESITSENVPVSDDLRAVVWRFFDRADKVYSAVSLVTGDRIAVRFEPTREEAGFSVPGRGELPPGVKSYPEFYAGAAREETPFGLVWRASTPQGALVYIVPVAWEPVGEVGDVIAELRPDALVGLAAQEQGGAGAGRTPFQLVALGRDGQIVYHTNDALRFQPVARVMPYFDGVAAEMRAGREGSQAYEDADGARWIAAYAPVGDLDLSVAVAANETAATAALRREGRIYVALSALLALAVVGLVVVREVRASRRIERIARAAREVAEGNLDKRLEVGEHDRARAIADSFNLMTERLREHVRRESEDRQFQAFMRLSAMLTHDLKNAITGLSMLVMNMERKFDDERFRADAVASLREATEKLGGIVARLNKPVETLSGEFRSALKPTDISALVRRVVEATAGQSSFHEIELRVPEGLEAVVDEGRIESVVENLVTNAVEAMGAKPGKLTVEAGREDGGRVFIAVADTGQGVSEEFIRTKMFRPFATTKKQGLGLGLYTCREVIEAHRGEIEVESKQGSGTRFRVVLPSRPVSLPRAASE